MSKMNTYVNKDGYKIRATEKAHKLYYEKQGFKLVADESDVETSGQVGKNPEDAACEQEVEDPEDAAPEQVVEDTEDATPLEKDFTDSEEYKAWSVASLKEALNEAGIEYPKNATKAELYQLLKAGKEE